MLIAISSKSPRLQHRAKLITKNENKPDGKGAPASRKDTRPKAAALGAIQAQLVISLSRVCESYVLWVWY